VLVEDALAVLELADDLDRADLTTAPFVWISERHATFLILEIAPAMSRQHISNFPKLLRGI
jgi:hypothetical protein